MFKKENGILTLNNVVEQSEIMKNLEKLIPSFKKAFNESEWNQRWTDESVRISLTNIFDFPHIPTFFLLDEIFLRKL